MQVLRELRHANPVTCDDSVLARFHTRYSLILLTLFNRKAKIVSNQITTLSALVIMAYC